MITYNQERYIAQAVESVLAQETSFDFEVVVGEDMSTDSTREVLSRYESSVRLLFRDRNLGMQPNYSDTVAQCRGEFVAVLEGDDYWTDPAKLQRQVEFMDAHPECSVCCHRAEVVDQDGRSLGETRPHVDPAPFTGTADILKTEYVVNPTVMYRRAAAPRLPEWCLGLKLGDWPLHILLSLYGTIGFLPDVMSAYRLHPQGMWSQLKEVSRLENEIEMYRHVIPEVPQEFRPLARFCLAERLYDLATNLARSEKLSLASAAFEEALSLQSEEHAFPERKIVRMRMRLVPVFNRLGAAVRKAKGGHDRSN